MLDLVSRLILVPGKHRITARTQTGTNQSILYKRKVVDFLRAMADPHGTVLLPHLGASVLRD
jgi:hypothetical protein